MAGRPAAGPRRAGWSPWPGGSSSTPPAPTPPGGGARSASRASPRPARREAVDDTLQLYFLCAHPSLTPASAVALTLRAVGGLTTRQIAQAYLVPEATMAQRISRAKRTVSGVRFDQPGDVATVLRVLYLVFNEGYSGDVDLAAEAIRLTRQLAARTDHAEVAGLLALMLLHHARRPARTGPDGRLVPLAEQDRSLWDTRLIAEGVDVLQAALARDRLGEFQAQAAIAALHADARTVEETDWVQIVEWYDELVRLTDSPVARLNRAVAVGEADGPRAGLAALAELDPALPRYTAVAAYLHERDGDPVTAARLYAEAARVGAQPPRTRPPHATGRPAQRAAARLSGGRQAFTAPIGVRNLVSSPTRAAAGTPSDHVHTVRTARLTSRRQARLASLGDEPPTALDCALGESPICGPLRACRLKFRLRMIKALADLDRLLPGQQSARGVLILFLGSSGIGDSDDLDLFLIL